MWLISRYIEYLIAVCFPWPINPSKTIGAFKDKPKWITFNISTNLVVNAGLIFGNSCFTQAIKALVIIHLIPFKFFFPNKKGLFPEGISICFSLLSISIHLYPT